MGPAGWVFFLSSSLTSISPLASACPNRPCSNRWTENRINANYNISQKHEKNRLSPGGSTRASHTHIFKERGERIYKPHPGSHQREERGERGTHRRPTSPKFLWQSPTYGRNYRARSMDISSFGKRMSKCTQKRRRRRRIAASPSSHHHGKNNDDIS